MTKSGAFSLLLKKNPSANFFSLFSIYLYDSMVCWWLVRSGDWLGYPLNMLFW